MVSTGWRDIASGARCNFPGLCRILNCLCFTRKRQGFAISSSVLSPKKFTGGLWSVRTYKLSHPCVKYRDYSSSQTIKRLSLRDPVWQKSFKSNVPAKENKNISCGPVWLYTSGLSQIEDMYSFCYGCNYSFFWFVECII